MEAYIVRVYRKTNDQIAGLVEVVDTSEQIPFISINGLDSVFKQIVNTGECMTKNIASVAGKNSGLAVYESA